MRGKAVLSLIVVFFTGACNKSKSSTPSSSTPSTVTSPQETTSAQEDAPQLAVNGKLALSLGLTDAEVSAVLGVAADGERISGEYTESSGDFSLNLPKEDDMVYTILFLDESKEGDEMIVAKFNSDGLNILGPNQDSPEELALGDLGVEPASEAGEILDASTSTSDDAVLDAMGLSVTEASQLKKYDNAVLSVLNVDVDGDGKVDAKGDYGLEFSFSFTSAEGDPNSVSSTLDSYKNTFLPDTQVIQRGRFSLTVKARKTLFSSVPSNVSFQFEEATEIDDTGTPMSVDDGALDSNGLVAGVAANSVITKQFTVSADPDNQSENYQFGLMFSGAFPKGKYVVKAGGKTLTFVGVNVASYNTAPPVIPFIKFNVDSAEKITGINYKWMTRNSDNTAWELAGTDLIKMYVEKVGGHFSMYVMDNGVRQQKRLEWRITPTKSEGEILFNNEMGCLNTTSANTVSPCTDSHVLYVTGFSTFEDAQNTTWDNFGWNNFTFLDKLGMMVSVN